MSESTPIYKQLLLDGLTPDQIERILAPEPEEANGE